MGLGCFVKTGEILETDAFVTTTPDVCLITLERAGNGLGSGASCPSHTFHHLFQRFNSIDLAPKTLVWDAVPENFVSH